MRRLSPAPCAPRAGWLALCARLCEHRHSVSVAACVMRSSPRDSTHTEGIRMHTAQRLNALQSPRILSSSQHTHACVLGCQHMISVIISMRGSGRSPEEKNSTDAAAYALRAQQNQTRSRSSDERQRRRMDDNARHGHGTIASSLSRIATLHDAELRVLANASVL